MPHVKFAYNRITNYPTTSFSPFEVVYDFNHLSPLDSILLPNDSSILIKDGLSSATFVKDLHERVRNEIEKKMKQYARQTNKGRKSMVFELGDWVWVHLRKDMFPSQRKSKLQTRGDGPLKVLERINGNAYKIDLPSEYRVSYTFNVTDLSSCDIGVLDAHPMIDSFQEGRNDRGLSK